MKKKFKRLAICLAVMAISVASYSVVTAGPKDLDTQQVKDKDNKEATRPLLQGTTSHIYVCGCTCSSKCSASCQ